MTDRTAAHRRPSLAKAWGPALAATALMLVTAGVAGCSSGTSSGAPATNSRSTASGPAPAVVETNPPGDIPDSQTFVPFDAGPFTVTVPEGWSQRRAGGTTVFSDKYNSVTLTQTPRSSAPTPATARATEVPAIAASSPGYVAGSVRTAVRRAGRVIVITYRARSAPNPVTGKYAITEVERYEFWQRGHEAVVTLAAPVGADNVDPWRIVTDSFRWNLS